MNLATRRQIYKGITKKDEHSNQKYNEIILDFLDGSIKRDSANLYMLNRRCFRDYEYTDFYQDFLELVLRAVNSIRFYEIFANAADFSEFHKYVYGTYKRLKFKMYNRWESNYHKKKGTISINFFEEEMEDIVLRSNPSLYYKEEDNFEKMSYLISKAISGIKNPLRKKILKLLFEKQMSNNKIAEVLGLNVNTVASHIHRALPELRSIIKCLKID